MWELIQSNLLEIIITLLTGVVTYIVTRVKIKYEEYVNSETKQKVVKTVVNAVEQLYADLDGTEKLAKSKDNIIALLQEKGLSITDLELDMMIEEVVNGFNHGQKAKGE
ncbi:MAG: phage holin, LLH family [bacterium]|nr:phage holin, LLH family [bacterium]